MSEKYFKDIESLIRSEFAFCNEVIESGKELESKIRNSNSVCIQVRRGDYVNNPQIAQVHQTTTLSYYRAAITMVQKEVDNPVFFVFSDDTNWCIENFKGLPSVYFIEKELENSNATNSDYLQLMQQCKHFIISNSTFAWWGAWLSDFEQKIVIAPNKWFNNLKINFNDIYCTSWRKINP
jgi:inosine/xanthosine triphosphate pyrophosphatase family protein